MCKGSSAELCCSQKLTHNEMGSNCKMPFCVSSRNFVIEIVLFSCQLRD